MLFGFMGVKIGTKIDQIMTTTWKNRLTVPLLYTIKTTTPQEYFTLLHETKDQKKSAKTANKYSIFIIAFKTLRFC